MFVVFLDVGPYGGLGVDIRDYFWFELCVKVFGGARFGFNLLEFIDFNLGLFGIDILDDDHEDLIQHVGQ